MINDTSPGDEAPHATALLWYAGPGEDDARGHAYFEPAGMSLELLRHSPSTTRAMVARLNAWTQTYGPIGRERWSDPASTWSWAGDVGAIEARLATADLDVRGELAGQVSVDFLRHPARRILAHRLAKVGVQNPEPWPLDWNANELWFGPGMPRIGQLGGRVAIAAARPGSKYATWGQTRTAVVFLSADGGRKYQALPWTLDPDSKTSCWPPEDVDSLSPTQDGLVAEWEDPWIDFDPGSQWRGTWDGRLWHVIERY